MKLDSLWLQNFRNHQNLILQFDPSVTIITGPNGSGKTNILEAIYLLAIGKSFRAEKNEQMVEWGSEVGRAKSVVDSTTELEAILTTGTVQGQRTATKSLLVNGVRRQLRKFTGHLRAVMFGPADMRLIEGSPSRRRDFLDNILSQIFPEYHRALLSYQKGVRRRNKVLLAIRDGLANHFQLYFWDKLLIKEGQFITQYRQNFINFLNKEFKSSQTGKISQLQIEYDHSIVSEQRLQQYSQEEIRAGVTLVGPHRDDIIVLFEELQIKNHISKEKNKLKETPNLKIINLGTYGSRGQQRMAVLWLKLGALSFIQMQTKEKPILLLDDIFSELDYQHRQLVVQAIDRYQTIITSASQHLVEGISGKTITLLKT